jgi:hypothetical protein
MSDTSATRAIKKEDVKRNTPGNPVEIPYVQIQEELTERGLIGMVRSVSSYPMEPRLV